MPTIIAPTYLNPSAIQFGSYQFPVSFIIAERDQDATLEDQKIPLRDGSYIPTGTRNAKTITLQGTIGGYGAVDSSGNFILNRDQATAEMQLLELALAQGKQPLIVGDSDGRFIICQRKSLKAKNETGARGAVVPVTIDFVAEDPRWLSASLRLLPTSGSNAPGSATATVLGNALAYPVLTVTATGTISAPTYSIAPAGSSGLVTVTPTLTMHSGDVLTIDSNPRNRANAVMLNGVPALYILSSTSALVNTTGNAEFFPYLLAGANTVTVSGSGFTWSLAWNDAFLY